MWAEGGSEATELSQNRPFSIIVGKTQVLIIILTMALVKCPSES